MTSNPSNLDVMVALSDLGAALDAALNTLATVQRQARKRTLTEADVREAWDQMLAARELCIELDLDPTQLQVTTHGGSVPNCYKYVAVATYVIARGDGKIEVYRYPARKRSYGGGQSTTVSFKLPTDAWARLGTRRNNIDLPLALRRWRRAQRAGLSLTGASLLWADAADVQRRARRVWRARRRLGGDRRDIEQWLLAALSSDDVTDLHRAIDAGEQLMRRTS